MSSLAATQADGYYFPPEYYESGVTSKNKWYAQQQKQKQGRPPKGDGGNNTKGEMVVRFELADPCECLKCHARIGRGTRFNAVKRRAETYLSSNIVIWEFTMTCRRCSTGQFIIRTDPKHRGFAYSGDLRKQVRDWNAADVGGICVEEKEDEEEDALKTSSVVDRLETQAFGLRNALTDRKELEQLITLNETTVGDDVTGNARVRQVFRRDRQARKRLRAQAAQQGWKSSLSLVAPSIQDESIAKGTVFGNGKHNEQKRWKRVREASIFAPSSSSSSSTTSQSLSTPLPVPSSRLGTADSCAKPMEASSSSSTPSQPRTERRFIVVGQQGNKERTSSISVPLSKTETTTTTTKIPTKESLALQSLVAGYASSSSDEED